MPHHVLEPRSVAAPGEPSVHEGRIGLTRVGFLTSVTLCSLTAGLFQKDPCSLDLLPLQLQASTFYRLCDRPTQSNAESWSGRKTPKSIPELSAMFLGLWFVHFYPQTFFRCFSFEERLPWRRGCSQWRAGLQRLGTHCLWTWCPPCKGMSPAGQDAQRKKKKSRTNKRHL